MSLNRREMLRLGAAGAGGLLLSGCGKLADPAASSSLVAGTDPLAPVPAAPAAPTAPGGINPALFSRAKAALDSRPWIRNRDFIGIVDFSQARAIRASMSSTCRAAMSKAIRVAHGSGSDPDHSGFLEHFSNQPGSEATSNGAYTTAETYQGKYGLSMKVRGLDWSNNNAEVPRDRHPQCLVCRAGNGRHPRQARPLARAASHSAARTSGR